MAVAASVDDLEEIAAGKASPRDYAEAGVTSQKEAKAKLHALQAHQHGQKLKIHGGRKRAVARRKKKN